MKRKLEILVLESPWSDKLDDEKSVRLFTKGWADLNNISLSYRMYHDTHDLSRWLEKYTRHPEITICYIAGHGQGGRLAGLIKGINLKNVSRSTARKGPGGNYKKGILFGACDVGKKLEDFIDQCGSRIRWVAGYDKETPWLEGTISDLLFIEYMTRGRIRRQRDGEFLKDKDGDFLSRGSRNKAEVVVKWVIKDYPLAEKCGLRAIDR